MPSFQITLSPSKRVSGRFVYAVRRGLQKALAEEGKKRGLTQAAIAKAIGVNRSVINRELRGEKDITLGRVAELAWALGRKAVLSFPEQSSAVGQNIAPVGIPSKNTASVAATSGTVTLPQPAISARAA